MRKWSVSPLYIALGDSMSIDDYAGGPGRGAASLLFRNYDVDFPDWSGRDLASLGYMARNLARDGATTAEVLDHQLPLITDPPTLVTLTFGGNDLLAVYGDSAAAHAVIDRVVTVGETILTRLRDCATDGCKIVVSTVYDPSDNTGGVTGVVLGPWSDGPGIVRTLNAALIGLAHRYGAVVADVYRRFLGHGALVGDPAQVEPRPANRDLWYCGVVEPNAWGAHQIRGTWWQALQGSGR